MFFREERQKVLNLDFQMMGKEISTRWRSTTKEDRDRFEVMAKEDAKRYKKEVELFQEEKVLANRRHREIQENEEQLKLRDFNTGGVKNTRMTEAVGESASSAAAVAPFASLRMEEPGNWKVQSQMEYALRHQQPGSPHHSAMTMPGGHGTPGDAMTSMEAARRQQQINAMFMGEELKAMEARALRVRMALAEQQQNLGLGMDSQRRLPPAIIEQLRRQGEAMAALSAERANVHRFPASQLYPNNVASSLYRGGALAGFASFPASSTLDLPEGGSYPQAQAPSTTFHDRPAFDRRGVAAAGGLNLQYELALSNATAAEREAILRSLAHHHSNFM